MRELGVLIVLLVLMVCAYVDRREPSKDHLVVSLEDSLVYLMEHKGSSTYRIVELPVNMKLEVK